MKRLFFTFVALLSFVVSNAQIGYQVALLNTATGEPRSNETVSCTIKLTNSEGAVVYQGNQRATSNDFGVVSLTVGNANTFSEMDWTKLPLYISVSVEGRLVGETEVLTVPVAEHAKHYGTLTYENIGSKKIMSDIYHKYVISGKTYSVTSSGISRTGDIEIVGNNIVLILHGSHGDEPHLGIYSPESDTIFINTF